MLFWTENVEVMDMELSYTGEKYILQHYFQYRSYQKQSDPN